MHTPNQHLKLTEAAVVQQMGELALAKRLAAIYIYRYGR
jgi:hypothetical protein